jgi:hypothetical protein
LGRRGQSGCKRCGTYLCVWASCRRGLKLYGRSYRFGTSLFVSILCFAGTSAIAQGTGQPTDPQIAHIAYTAGQIDIRAAKQALGKSQNKAVKAFAGEMVRDHEAVSRPSRCSIS